MLIGIPAAIALSGALGAGSNILGSLLKPKQTPSTSSYNNRQQTSSSGSTQRILTAEQQALLPMLSQVSQTRINDPGAGLNPIREMLRSDVNRNFEGAEAGLRTQLGRGDARSGVLGAGKRKLAQGRATALSDADAKYYQMLLQRQDEGIGLAERILSQIFGQSTSSEGTQTGTGESTGTQGVMSQNPWQLGMGGISDTLETLMAMTMLNKSLGGKLWE